MHRPRTQMTVRGFATEACHTRQAIGRIEIVVVDGEDRCPGKIGKRVEQLFVGAQIALHEADLEAIACQRHELFRQRSIRKLLEREVEDDLARLERLRQQSANDPMQFADPHREAGQADHQVLDHFRLPQPRGSGRLPHGDFAAAQRDGITFGLPLAGFLDAVFELVLQPTRGIEHRHHRGNVADNAAASRRSVDLAAGSAMGQTIRFTVMPQPKSAGSLRPPENKETFRWPTNRHNPRCRRRC